MSDPYCSAADVKARLASDNVNMSSAWDTVLGDIVAEVTAELDRAVRTARVQPAGWSFVADEQASERRFTSRYGGSYLAIDDCVEVASVSNRGVALTASVDYVTEPLSDLPITGIRLLRGAWDETPGAIALSAKWGYAATLPADVKAAAITESVRAFRGAGVGYDDRVGMTPFGTVITLPAFTTRTLRLILDYAMPARAVR